MRRNFCQACSFNAYGVKTRIEIPHTCGLDSPPPPVEKHRETTKEEIELYIVKLKELMEGDKSVPSVDGNNATTI